MNKTPRTLRDATMPDGTPLYLEDWSGVYIASEFVIRAQPIRLVGNSFNHPNGQRFDLMICFDEEQEAVDAFAALETGSTTLLHYEDLFLVERLANWIRK